MAAMNRYLEEISKTKASAFQEDVAAFSAQRQREKDAEQAYHEAQRAFSEAPWEEC